ncbi:MAG: hypothetical protein JNL82_25680 [Myxococcales bacterium]|jgi:hypothetical protein|nr:hypothetical protein [Myxococcales bacterium]
MAQDSDENQARQTIERWRASGLGVVPFTKREGISVGKFYRMRAKVDAVDPCIVPVVVRSEPTPARMTPASSFEVELASGVKIRVAAGFDAGELVRLVEALSGVRC